MSVLDKSYADFQTSYNGKIGGEPLLSKIDFQKLALIIMMDLLWLDDDDKTLEEDLRIEFETVKQNPAKITCYCLILHVQIMSYNFFSEKVRKM